MKLERRKKQNQPSPLNKYEEKYKKYIKDNVKNMQYHDNVFMKYPLTQDMFFWDVQKDFLVNMARNNRDEGMYRLRERRKSSCATGSCSQYDNYLTVRPDFPSENDIRSRRSFYNLKPRKGYIKPAPTDVDVLYESRSDPYKRKSGKNTRQNSNEELDWNTKSELIPLVNSREMGADSHFIQSRLMLQKAKTDKRANKKVEQKKHEYHSSKESEYRTPRYSSVDSMEVRTKKKKHFEEDEKDDKHWNGPLDLYVKPKMPKFSQRRSSPSGNDKEYFTKYTEYAWMKKKMQSTKPNKMNSVTCSTDSILNNDLPKKNKKQDLTTALSNKKKGFINLNPRHNSYHKIIPTKNTFKTPKNDVNERYYEDQNNKSKQSRKYDSELKNKQLQLSRKSQGTPTYNNSYKSYTKETESPGSSDYSKSKYQLSSNSRYKNEIKKRKSILKELDDKVSHRKDTIASSLKYSKKYVTLCDLNDDLKPVNDFYIPPELRSISEVIKANKKNRPYDSAFLNAKIKDEEERERMSSNSRKQERHSLSRTPERKPRRSTYFDSNIKVEKNAGKMRKLDVSSDCGVACEDKETDKYHNIGLKYGRQSVDPALFRKKVGNHRQRGYLDLKETPTLKATPKKKGLPAPKERVSFKDEKVDFRSDKGNNDYTSHTPPSIARRPCIKNYTNSIDSETCTECVNNKKKNSRQSISQKNRVKDMSICPIDRKYKTPIVETQQKGVPYLKNPESSNNVNISRPKKLFNDKVLKKTNSEDLSKKFCHKTVLEKYPDDAEHLRDYSEEFTKQPFRSTQFNPNGHDPPSLKPLFYPKTRTKPYDYSGNLLPDDKRSNNMRKLSPTMYVKREKKELSYKSTIGENFFKHNRSKYIDINKQLKGSPTNDNETPERSTFRSEVTHSNTKNQLLKNKYQNFLKTSEKHYDKSPPHENKLNISLSAHKNLSYATINEKFRNSDYTESSEKKYDEKLQKSRSGFATRTNSVSSTEYLADERTREMKEPDNDVISTILASSSKQDSFITSRAALEKYKQSLGKGNKYEIVYLKDKPPDTPTTEVPKEKTIFNKDYFEPNNRENRQEGLYDKSYSEEQPLDQKNVLPNENNHIFNKQRDLNDSLEKNPANQLKEDPNAYHHSINNKHDSSNKTAQNQSKLDSPGPSTDWRLKPKLPSNDFKMFNVNPNEVEVAPDEKLLPNMIGHAAMHNWEQAQSYFFSKTRPKPLTGNKVKMPPNFRKTRLRPNPEDYDDYEEEADKGEEGGEEGDDDDDDDDGEGEETDQTKSRKKKTQMQSIPIIISDPNAPVPAKRFKRQRINPHSRFDAGYDFLQTADSNTSIETMQSYTKTLCTSAVKPIKRESAIKRFAKRLFSIKRKETKENPIQTRSDITESSEEDSPNSAGNLSNKPKPKRKVSFSVPLYL